MSDTPRTDAAAVIFGISYGEMDVEECPNNGTHVPIELARELERELSFEKAARRDEESWWRETRDYKNRAEKAEAENARLREALELLLYVRGTSEDTPEVADQARAALAQSEKTKT